MRACSALQAALKKKDSELQQANVELEARAKLLVKTKVRDSSSRQPVFTPPQWALPLSQQQPFAPEGCPRGSTHTP